jgi:hypothetical protein
MYCIKYWAVEKKHNTPLHNMEPNHENQASAALPLGKDLTVPNEYDAWRA